MIVATLYIDHLFSRVNQKSLYIADQIDPVINEAMIDKIPITEDEYDFFKIALRDACAKLLIYISPLVKGVQNPLQVNEEDNEVTFTIDDSRHYNPDMLGVILPDLLMKGIVSYIIKEWLRLKGINQIYFQSEMMEYDEVARELKNLSKGKTARIKQTYF